MKMIKFFLLILTVVATTAVPVQAQSFLTNGLLAYYPFNGNASDLSGHGNNGTNYGATFVRDRFGLTNRAIYFNGGASVLTGFFPPLGTASRTFSGWFNVPMYSADTTLMFYGGDSAYPGDRFQLEMFDNSQFILNCSDGGVLTAENYADSTWHSFAVVVPSNAANSSVVFYLDGVLKTNLVVNSPGNLINTSAKYPLQFGELWGNQTWFTGSLDDVRIYNRALSSNEVAQLYAYDSTPPITITNQPNGYVIYGQNTNLSVAVSSPSPVTYQWYFVPANNAGQAGAYAITFNGFVVGAVVTNGGFGYGNMPNVSFVGGGGSGASGFGTNLNGIVTGIKVTATGSGYSSLPAVVIDPPNGFLPGQTNSTLAITNANETDLGNYYVVVSNATSSATSSVVSLTLLYPPSITNQPQDQIATAYSTAAFAVGASGTAPLTYQWLANGSILPGAMGSTLTFPTVIPPELGPYSVVVANNYGAVTSSVANLYLAPYLKTPFAGEQTYWGQTNTLSVAAWGSGDLAYQWYFNGVAIPDATSSNLVLSGIQFTNAGSYSVVVSSPYGSVTNTPEQVVVNPSNTTIEFCANVVIQGTVGYTYTIESTTNLSDPNSWVVQTNLTLTQPVQFWDDTSVDVRRNQQNYYRVLPGQ